MSSYRGDYRAGDIVRVPVTFVDTGGAPSTPGVSPAVVAYRDSDLDETTAGITLTTAFDGRPGYCLATVNSALWGSWAGGHDFSMVMSAGTVGAVSLNGYLIGSFSIENRSALRPTVAARTLDVTATGGAGIDWNNVENQGTLVNLSSTTVAGVVSLADEVDQGLTNIRLHELLAADSDIDGASPPVVGSVFHELLTKTPASFTYDQTTDSLEALRDRGDVAWIGVETSGAIAVAVWNEQLSGHLTGGSAGEALFSSGAAAVTTGALLDVLVSSRLAPTVSGRTLDVTATGAAGVDWGNVENQSTTVSLSATTIAGVINAVSSAAPTSGAVAAAVWNEALALIHTTAGTAGQKVYDALAPTVSQRTLDVTATGAAGMDWANVEGQATVVNLSATTVSGISASGANMVADHVIRRNAATARASGDGDAVAFRSLLGGIAKLVNRVAESSPTNLRTYEENDVTAFGNQTITTTASQSFYTDLNTV